MTLTIPRLTALISLSVITFSGAAMAKPHDHENEKGKGKGHERQWERKDDKHEHRERDHHHGDRDERRVIVHDRDRVVIREYIGHHYASSCPPGLAKKHNGCLPPGQAKRYVVGRRLPDVIVYEPVPRDLLVQLEPVPVGYQYVMVDRDVLLIAEGSKKVIDAITLFSAVGR